jgi:hypothetical protein
MHGGRRLTRLGIICSRTSLCAVAVVAVCSGWKPASAQEWQLTSNISQSLLYSDNLLLSRNRNVDAFGSITAPQLHLERNSPTSTIGITGRFEFAEYLDHSEFNSQDQFLTLNVQKAMSERSTLRLGANFTHDTTLKSDQDVTGKVLDKSFDFINWSVKPSWSYLVSPLDEIALNGSYRQVNYDTAQKTDYQYFGPSIDYNHQLSELAKFTSTVGFFRYIPDKPGDNYTDTIQTLFGYAYSSSERFSINGGVGLSYSMRTKDPGKDSSDLGYRLKFNMNYLMNDQTSMRVGLSHDTEPSGDGDQVVRNRADLGFDYKFAPLITGRLTLDYADNVDVLGFEGESTTDESTSRYVSVRPSVGWQLTEDWILSGEYRFRYRLFEDDNESTTSNTVMVTLRYNFPTLDWTED